MIVIFDENAGGQIDKALALLFENGVEFTSIQTLKLRGTKDIDLFPLLKERMKDYDRVVFISCDTTILRRPPEIQALKESGMIVFMCPSSFSQKSLWDRAAILIGSFNAIYEKASKVKPPNSQTGKVFSLPACKGHLISANQIKEK